MSAETLTMPGGATDDNYDTNEVADVETLDTAELNTVVDQLLAKDLEEVRGVLSAETGDRLHTLVDKITDDLLSNQAEVVARAFPELEDREIGVKEAIRNRIVRLEGNDNEDLKQLETLASEALEKEKRMANIDASPESKSLFGHAVDAAKSYLMMNAKVLGWTAATVVIVAGLLAVGWYTGAIPAALTWLMKTQLVTGAMEAINSVMSTEAVTAATEVIAEGAEVVAETAPELAESATEAATEAAEVLQESGSVAQELMETAQETAENLPTDLPSVEEAGELFDSLD